MEMYISLLSGILFIANIVLIISDKASKKRNQKIKEQIICNYCESNCIVLTEKIKYNIMGICVFVLCIVSALNIHYMLPKRPYMNDSASSDYFMNYVNIAFCVITYFIHRLYFRNKSRTFATCLNCSNSWHID